MTFRNSGRFPVVMAALHLALCLAAATGQSEGSWRWFPVFLVDFPVSIAFLPLGRFFPPLVVLGVSFYAAVLSKTQIPWKSLW